jgi:hypothetical protein
MKFFKFKLTTASLKKYGFLLLSAFMLLDTTISKAAIGYKDGFDRGVFLGHSFFKPGVDDLEILAPYAGYDRHNQYRHMAGGSTGDPGSIWRDVGENEGPKAEIKEGGVELLALTSYNENDGDSDYEDYVQWIDFTLQYNADTLDTMVIMAPWDSYKLYLNYDEYRARMDEVADIHNTIVQQLRIAYPDLTILHVPVGEAMVRLWKLFDDGLLAPQVKGVWKLNDLDYLQTDNIGHAGYVLEDAVGLVWMQTIYPETDIRTLDNLPTYQKNWTYDLRQLAYEVWSDESFAHRYNDGPINPAAPEFTSNPIVKNNAPVGISYSGASLADDALDDNGDILSFAKVSGPGWLSVASNGALSGTPSESRVGLNNFVVSVSDGDFAPVEGTLKITVVDSAITTFPLEDASFENVENMKSNGNWGSISSVWNDSGAGRNEVSSNVFTNTADGDWVARLRTISPIYQDLGLTVNEGETLEIAFSGGRALDGKVVSGGGVIEASFLVGSTRYSSLFDTSELPADSWQTFTHSATVSNSGVLRVEFQRLSGEPFIDAVSDVKIIGGASNTAPEFTSDNYTLVEATADQAYSGTIAGNANDADGDQLTYSKVSGAEWLNVAADGALSGTPNSGYIGSNSATVMVDDGNSGTDTAVLNIRVNDAPANGVVIDEGFEVFDFTGWDTDWIRVTGKRYSGSASMKGNSARNDLISPEVDASALSTITLSFYYYTQGVDTNDNLVLQLWNGNSYQTIADLSDGADRTWLEYSRAINVSQTPDFFINDLKFKIEGSSLDSGEAIWVDDVLVIGE